MKYNICLETELRLVRCKLEGELDIEESIQLSKRLREKADKLNFNILYDARKLKEPQTAMPVHDFTAKLSSILESIVNRKNVWIAFLYKEGNYDGYWQFYEEAASAKGLKVRVFIDREEAISWLSSCPV